MALGVNIYNAVFLCFVCVCGSVAGQDGQFFTETGANARLDEGQALGQLNARTTVTA